MQNPVWAYFGRRETKVPTKPETAYVLNKLEWMRARRIWPNGLRYLWTDAFGVVLLVSLYDALGDDKPGRSSVGRRRR